MIQIFPTQVNFNSVQQDNIHAKTGVEEKMRADWADGF